ncbi:MAG TPA: hypothetical protein PKZ46_07105 [Candidatus Cloacimonadota bacterium]|nr:hypothetical protein [Candidatus Cloacimonadota bacterium]
MGRKQKHPEHKEKAVALMNELLDEVVAAWTAEKDPELKTIAEEIELSPAKLRKLLITAGERDKHTYYESPVATQIVRLKNEGRAIAEIQQIMGLSYTSVQGYLPHNRVYNLDTMSAECERIKLYRSRKRAFEELKTHLSLPDETVWLWRCVIAFENYPFKTAGRGGKGGVKFKYTVSRSGSAGGHHYEGETVSGFGNELWVTTGGEEKKKSISRSTIDLALKKTHEKEIAGPKALGIPGAGSYLYSMFVRFGLINHD